MVITAMIGKGRDFKCGRQFAAWLGLVPNWFHTKIFPMP
jgi:hypothetical protein